MLRRIATRAKGEGISDFADSGFTELTIDRSYMAVPVALAHLQFWDKRAWVIEPGEKQFVPDWRWKENDRSKGKENIREVWPVLTADLGDQREKRNEGTWSLRCRQALVGCERIVPDGDACVLLETRKCLVSRIMTRKV